LIDERYEAQRSVVVTTNLDQASLEEQIGARTVSRLVEICGDPLPLFGEDLRYRVEAS
jgi:DNA replication protein DnaC